MKVYFVRHGESEGNIARAFQPATSPLTERGRQQAEAVAARCSKLSFDTLVASPLPRTRETAEAIARLSQKELIFSELFVERVKPTRLAGKAYDDPEIDALWKQWNKSLYTSGLRVEDGENYDDLVARADAAIAYLEARDDDAVVVVTHGFFLRVLLARVLIGTSLTGELLRHFVERTILNNSGITVLTREDEYEGKFWRLWMMNDHAHL